MWCGVEPQCFFPGRPILVNAFFLQLGRTVRERWMQTNFSPEAFPGLAREALEETPPCEHVEVGELIRDFLLNDEQPCQSQSGFGQPELVVFEDARFYIQVLFWLDGSTDIHQHEFSGAFHVFEGSSIHSRFEFLEGRPVTAHLRVGRLDLSGCELLERGRTVEIHSGRGFVHALFHLETPSITVVLRTHTDPGTGPQFTYLPPHLAVDPLHNDALTRRRKQLLDALEAVGDASYPDLVVEMLKTLDFERGFFVLQNGVSHLRALGCWEEVWEVFERRHGPLAAYVAPTLEEILRRDALVALRSFVTDPEHRFLLALLLNLRGREEVLRLVSQRFEGKPEKLLARWFGEIAEEDPDLKEQLQMLLPEGFGA